MAGFSVTAEPMSVRRVIGFMPDDFGVYDGMKVWEFLDFFAVAYEIPRSYRKKIIGEVLELLDLTHKRDDYVNGLSKGMKQRLCLAKTLVHDPPVLILDEPASGLDPRARLEMKALLNELKQMGKTILISSHILSELADFCTSIGIIERGKMLAAGSIQEIQQQIRSHRVLKVRVLDESTERAAGMLRDRFSRSAWWKPTITPSPPSSRAKTRTWPGCSTGWFSRGSWCNRSPRSRSRSRKSS